MWSRGKEWLLTTLCRKPFIFARNIFNRVLEIKPERHWMRVCSLVGAGEIKKVVLL